MVLMVGLFVDMILFLGTSKISTEKEGFAFWIMVLVSFFCQFNRSWIFWLNDGARGFSSVRPFL
jgi:hypothetical protein